MKIAINKKIITEIISGLFILLFVYTAISKIYEMEKFQAVLSKSPLIDKFSTLISWSIPTIELAISILLFIPRSRRIGFKFATALMICFTGYLTYMIYFTSNLPCSCGGVINNFTWKEHLLFNIGYTCLGLVGIWLSRRRNTVNPPSNSQSDSELRYA